MKKTYTSPAIRVEHIDAEENILQSSITIKSRNTEAEETENYKEQDLWNWAD